MDTALSKEPNIDITCNANDIHGIALLHCPWIGLLNSCHAIASGRYESQGRYMYIGYMGSSLSLDVPSYLTAHQCGSET